MPAQLIKPSGGTGGASDSFTVIQPDFGTSPTAGSATDTLTLSDDGQGTARISGDSSTDTITWRVLNVRALDNSTNDATQANTTTVRAGDKTAGASGIGGNAIVQAGRNTAQSASSNWYGTTHITAGQAKTFTSLDGGYLVLTGFDRIRMFLDVISTSTPVLDFTSTRAIFRQNLTALDNTYDLGTGTERWRNLRLSGSTVQFDGIPTYADDAAAGTGGLAAGRVYKTSTGELRIKT